jgi:competence protein ComEA
MESLPSRPPPARPLVDVVRNWIAWFGVVRLIVTAVSVLGIGAGAYWLLRAPATPIENSLPYAIRTTSTTVAGTTSTSVVASMQPTTTVIVVYVAGAVAVPGVYELAGSARVHDAVEAAGGLTPEADVDALNLAAFVADGDRVFAPRVGQSVPVVVTPSGGGAGNGTLGGGSASAPAEPVNINQASVDELDGLPGIGPATAAAIVAHRQQSGPFASVDDLLDVRGIGPAKLDAIRGLVTV